MHHVSCSIFFDSFDFPCQYNFDIIVLQVFKSHVHGYEISLAESIMDILAVH